MDTPDRHNRLFLVRAAPESPKAKSAFAAAHAAVTETEAVVTAFFHGPAVRHGLAEFGQGWVDLADSGRVRLEVCSAAWQRRCGVALAKPFEASSLVQFWRQALAASSVTCFGRVDAR